MQILRTPQELERGDQKVCLAIGFFDGVHLGHQQIIRQTIADARQHDTLALIITFDQHPNTVVAPERVPPLIYTLSQKIRALETLGADALLLIRFDRAFSEQTGEAFIRALVRDLGRVQSLCVGADFQFGRKRTGNVSLLRQLGAELHFTVHGHAAVSLDGRVVSSTRIREAIRAADFDAASQMLGRAYSLGGPVVRGNGMGRRLGFPTANVNAAGLVLPPNGVYVAQALIAGKTHHAAVNVGVRPTLENAVPQIHVEAYLFDFTGDLYGEEIEIIFAEKLRDEKKFASLEELKMQIAQDVVEARRRI